jgi:hypothetical protein
VIRALLVLVIASYALAPAQVADATWDPDTRLTSNGYADNNFWTCQRRVAAGPDGRVHVVWYVQNSALGTYNFQVYAKRYNPGTGWSADTMISADLYAASTYNKYPTIAVDSSGRVWVAWGSGSTSNGTDYIYYKTCLPTGSGNDGWDATSTLLSISAASYTKECPALAATPDGHVHAAWLEYTANRYIAYRERIGGVWQTQVNLDLNSSYKAYPSLAGSRDNNLHLTYYGYVPPNTSGYYEVMYKGRVGTTWGPIENVSASPNHSMYQTVCVDPVTNRPHAVWQDYVASGAPYRLVHAERTGPGTWTTDTVSDVGSAVNQQPGQIVFTPDGLGHAVWRGRSATMTRDEVMYNERSALGTWGTPVAITDTASSKDRPSIADGGTGAPADLHVVWSDWRDGNSEIYYKHGSILPPPPPTVTLTAPNGGETLYVGQAAAVRSLHGGGYTLVDSVFLSTNGGSNWQLQFARAGADSHPWSVPALPTTAARVRILAANPGGTGADESDADFTIADPDAGVDSIYAPAGQHDTGTTVTPRARIVYTGNIGATLRAALRLRTPSGAQAYFQALDFAATGPSFDTLLDFPQYVIGPDTGTWSVRCSVWVAGDVNPDDNVRDAAFTVVAPETPEPGWLEMAPAPLSPSGRAIKDGGWLVDRGNRLFAAKAYKTADFYSYYPVGDSWNLLTPWPTGTEGKPPYKGAAACLGEADHIYATKGNNSLGFWMYDVSGDSWHQLPDVPLGLSNKKVKGGTDLAYCQQRDDDTGYVYLLKGYRTEFFRFNVVAQQWQSLPDAPAGIKAKYDKGSWLAYRGWPARGDYFLFAHKAKYHEFYRFNIGTMAWDTSLTGMPLDSRLTGKHKKSKDGAEGVAVGDYVYALKGGNTNEFWRYDIEGDSWLELDTIPQLGSTLRRKRVKGGGDLVEHDDLLYALKGNKTLELWRYTPYPESVARAAQRPSAQSASSRAVVPVFSVGPNPLAAGSAVLRWSRSLVGPVRVSVFDAVGRVVISRAVDEADAGTLTLGRFAAGVYLVRLSAPGFTGSQKLVVGR